MNLILCPVKILTSLAVSEWSKLVTKNCILVTGMISLEYDYKTWQLLRSIFVDLIEVENYAESDLLTYQVFQISKKYNLQKIIPLSEKDISRAAYLREKLGIQGANIIDVTPFRNKWIMKKLASNKGINVAKMYPIYNTADFFEAINKKIFPFIIKPVSGRGSENTFKISDEAEACKFIKTSNTLSEDNAEVQFLLEEYLDGEMYHIDGLMLNKKIETIGVSQYINNCLQFLEGSYLGSITLNQNSKLKEELQNFADNLLTNVYTPPSNNIFHIEVFVLPSGIIYLCEVAIRVGGNGIKNEILYTQGKDILFDFLNYEINGQLPVQCIESSKIKIFNNIGRLLIPPPVQSATLLSIPLICPFSWVISYHQHGILNSTYQKMKLSNNEIASFLFHGTNEADLIEKTGQLYQWFKHHTKWEML